MSDEHGDLLEPIVIEWTVDKLDDCIRRYKVNNNLSINLWQSVRGTLHITQEWAGGIQNATIGLDGDRQGDGTIRLTPYLNDVARASAAAAEDLRRLRDALQAATAAIKPAEVDPSALGIRAKQLGIRTDTLMRWERILQNHLPKGRTQIQIAELEDRDIETIKHDYERMREKGLLPPLPEKPTPKLTP
jgi:hypothetical protein